MVGSAGGGVIGGCGGTVVCVRVCWWEYIVCQNNSSSIFGVTASYCSISFISVTHVGCCLDTRHSSLNNCLVS